MDLFFQLVEQAAVKDSGILLVGSDNDGVGFLDVREVLLPGSGDNVIADTFLENIPELLTVPGIRPQNEDGVRHFVSRDEGTPRDYRKEEAPRGK